MKTCYIVSFNILIRFGGFNFGEYKLIADFFTFANAGNDLIEPTFEFLLVILWQTFIFYLREHSILLFDHFVASGQVEDIFGDIFWTFLGIEFISLGLYDGFRILKWRSSLHMFYWVLYFFRLPPGRTNIRGKSHLYFVFAFLSYPKPFSGVLHPPGFSFWSYSG